VKVVRNKLFEDPDQSFAKGGQPLDWSVDLAHPFGVGSNGKVEVGPPSTSHEEVGEKSAFAFNNYEGRIWPLAGVIAFWEAPTKGYLMEILQELIMHDEIFVYELEMEDFDDFLFDIPNPDLSADDEDLIVTLKEYPANPKLKLSHLNRPEHTKSPMDPTKKTPNQKVTDKVGQKIDDKNTWKRNQPFESVVRTSLTESPDTMCANPRITVGAWGEYHDSWHCATRDEKVAAYNDDDARAFGIINKDVHMGKKLDNGSFWMSTPGETHLISGRHDYKFAGRIWLGKGLISFWEYPKPGEMAKFLDKMAEYMENKRSSESDFIKDENNKKIFNKPIRNALDDFLVEVIEKDDKIVNDTKNYDKSEKAVWKTKEGQWDTWGNDPHIRFSTKYIKLKNYDNLTSVKQLAPEDMAGEHGKSPMDPTKKKRNVPTGFGSKHPDAEAKAEERRNKPFESLITESPDKFEYDGKEWGVFGSGALAFEVVINDKTDEIIDVKFNPKEGYHCDFSETTNGHDRIYPGRIYPKPKVITFWAYPSSDEFDKIINLMEKSLDQDLWNKGWKVEVYLGQNSKPIHAGDRRYGNNYDRKSDFKEFIPIEQYMGSHGPPAEEKQKHLMSYKEKLDHKRSTGWGKGSGSDKYGKKKPLPYRQAMQAESFYPGLNENPNATIDPKVWAKYKNPNATP